MSHVNYRMRTKKLYPRKSKVAHNFNNLTDRRFGRLLVEEFLGNELVGHDKGKPKYKSVFGCTCDCGTLIAIRGGDLLSKKVVSCGCYKNEMVGAFSKKTKTKDVHSGFNVVWQGYRRGAKMRDLKFELSKVEFFDLTQKNCFYCGQVPSRKRATRIKGKIQGFIFNGIDRFDSSKGYILENCVPACAECNIIKRDFTYKQFISRISKILHHHEERNTLE